jgi:cell division protein FtsB
MSNQNGLDPKDLDDLIGRLSRRKQESPSDQIPFQDVKDILQDEGLLESLLKEHISSRNQALDALVQKNQRQRAWLVRGFTFLSALIAGGAGFGGYSIANKLAANSANDASLSAQNTFGKQNTVLETKVSELETQIATKDREIADLKSKVGTAATSPSIATAPAAVGSPTTNDNVANPPAVSSSALPATIAAAGGSVPFDAGSATLQGCERVGKVVKCSVNLVSKVDRNVSVGSCNSDTKTRIFDPQGVEHKANIVEFGKDIHPNGCTVQTGMIKDIPAKVTLTFNNVAPGTKSVKALEISIATPGERDETEWQSAQFRDVAIR